MIRFSLFIFVILLFALGLYLRKKPETFAILIKNSDELENKHFFKKFGFIFLFLAILGIIVLFFNRTIFSLSYIFFILVISTTFSLLFAQKIH